MTMSYVSRSDLIFRSHFIIFIPRIEIEDSEAVGISNIISNLITMFPRSTLTALPSDLFTSFINCLTLLTCSFGRSAALEEVVSNNTFTCFSKIWQYWLNSGTTCNVALRLLFPSCNFLYQPQSSDPVRSSTVTVKVKWWSCFFFLCSAG